MVPWCAPWRYALDLGYVDKSVAVVAFDTVAGERLVDRTLVNLGYLTGRLRPTP